MTTTRPLRTSVAALAIAGLAAIGALVPALSASAHDQLVSTSPADGSTVTELSNIELTYSATLLSIGEDQRSAAIQVVHDGRYYESACPTLRDNTASVAVAPGSAGDYEVRWQVVSSDGHTISGQYSFVYQPGSGAAAAEGADAPACGGEEAGASADQPSDDSILIGAAVGIVGLAAIAIVVAVFLGRRRDPFGADSTAEDGPDDAPGAARPQDLDPRT